MGGERGVEHLDGFEVERFDAVEDSLAAAQQDGRDVEGEFIDDASIQAVPRRIPMTGWVSSRVPAPVVVTNVGSTQPVVIGATDW